MKSILILVICQLLFSCGRKTVNVPFCDTDCEAAKKDSAALKAFMAWSLSHENTYRDSAGYYSQFLKLSDDKSYAVFHMYQKDGTSIGIRAVKLDGYDTSMVGDWDWNRHIIQGEDYAFANLIDNGDGTYNCNTSSGCWSWSAMNMGGFGTGIYNITFSKEDQLKDLEKFAYEYQQRTEDEMAGYLVENYGLSQERSLEIANITNHLNKAKRRRSLTEKDYSVFSKKVLNTDYQTAKKALENHIQGNSKDLETILDKASELNGTSPEVINEVLGDFLLN